MSDQCTLTMEVILLVQTGNWGRIMKTWMIIKYNLLCQSMVEIGLSGIRILHLQATWVLYGRGKSDQWEQCYHLYWNTWAKSGSWVSHYTHDRSGRYTEPHTPYSWNNDPTSFQPLSPINLLTVKSKVVSPPPGKFLKSDIYSKRRWKHIQHIGNKFCSHWRKEYLQSLQECQKWTSRRRNFGIYDIVMLKQLFWCSMKSMVNGENHWC